MILQIRHGKQTGIMQAIALESKQDLTFKGMSFIVSSYSWCHEKVKPNNFDVVVAEMTSCVETFLEFKVDKLLVIKIVGEIAFAVRCWQVDVSWKLCCCRSMTG